ncbi:uncharacterized protein [Oscarella lobularis]|uniref:uncharacterized protein n=1 Tax=Oscarella lobularis TaxID=121494 RepID=UPI003313E2D8
MRLIPAFLAALILLLRPTFVATNEEDEAFDDDCLACVASKRNCLSTNGGCGRCRDGYVEVNAECERRGKAAPGNDPDSSRRRGYDNDANPTSSAMTTIVPSDDGNVEQVYLIVVIVCSCLIALMGIVIAYLCWAKVRSQVQNSESEYSYKQVDEGGESEDKDKINGYTSAQRAQLYMYNQKRQQIKSMKPSTPSLLSDYHSEEGSGSGVSPAIFNSTDLQPGEDEDTIYECPGPSSAGDMKIVNPVYQPRRMSSTKRQSATTITTSSSSRSSPTSN